MTEDKQKIRIKIEKIKTGAVKYRNFQLDIDALADVQERIGKEENGYRIVSYEIK